MSSSPQSSLLESVPHVRYGFGTAAEPIPAAFESSWARRPQKTQVHSADICEVTAPSQRCGSADGFYSKTPGVPITVLHADCVPILLARRDGGMVAALHGGWRGLFGGIIDMLFDRLRARGERPASWVAAVGPAIGPCCYEVDAELAGRFESRFPRIPSGIIRPESRRLDLAAIADHELKRLGVPEVQKMSMCTRCDRLDGAAFRFKSYRRADSCPAQHSGLMISH